MNIVLGYNIAKAMQLQLKLGLFNVENLFLLFDQELPDHYLKLNEAQWQKLSKSVYPTKELKKCISIGQVILENSPDIMMLCEIGGKESLENFNKYFLNEIYTPVLIEGNSDRNIDVGFLIKKNLPFQYKLKSNKDRALNYLYPHEQTSLETGYPVKAPTQYFSRDCVELNLYKENLNTNSLTILLTHLKSRLDPERIDPGGLEKRSAELRTLIDIYTELLIKQKENNRVLVCGDFNGYAGKKNTDEEFKLLYDKTDLEDVLELSGVTDENRSTFYQVKCGGRVEGKQIDFCFISEPLKKYLKKSSAHVYRFKDEFGFALNPPKTLDDKSRLPSDHYPIFFTLENIDF